MHNNNNQDLPTRCSTNLPINICLVFKCFTENFPPGVEAMMCAWLTREEFGKSCNLSAEYSVEPLSATIVAP